MRSIAALLAAAAAALALAAPAAAVPSPQKLQRQIDGLKERVATLERRVRSLEGRLDGLDGRLATAEADLLFVGSYSLCGQALIWDAFDLIAVLLGFDPGPPADDGGACAYFGITRRPEAAGVLRPPTGELAALRRARARAVAGRPRVLGGRP